MDRIKNVAFVKYNDIIYKAAAPAISKVSEIAARDGRPHCKIISTTPKYIMGLIVVTLLANFLNCWKLFRELST